MFGYVKIYKDELKVKEYNAFRAYYCGLCKTLKDEYGFFSRLGLNYDSVFLAVLLSSVTENRYSCHAERCIANPVKKKPIADKNVSLSYSAAVMVILALLKLKDDIKDEYSIKSLLAYTMLLPARHRIKKRYGTLYQKSKEYVRALSQLERENCSSQDALSNAFASLMQLLFTPDFVTDENTRRILGHIGYLLGRFIYILDAYEDIEQDKKKKCFNMFLALDTPPDKEVLYDSLTFTLSSIANSYELLNLKCNKNILDNIIYLGLPHVLDDVLHGTKGQKGEIQYERPV